MKGLEGWMFIGSVICFMILLYGFLNFSKADRLERNYEGDFLSIGWVTYVHINFGQYLLIRVGGLGVRRVDTYRRTLWFSCYGRHES